MTNFSVIFTNYSGSKFCISVSADSESEAIRKAISLDFARNFIGVEAVQQITLN